MKIGNCEYEIVFTNLAELSALIEICHQKKIPVLVGDILNPEVFKDFKFEYEWNKVNS